MTQEESDFAKAEVYLTKSIELGRSGAEIATRDDSHDQKAEFWAFAAQHATSKYHTFSDPAALDQAVDFYERALQVVDRESQVYAACLLNQANCLASRFERQQFAEEDHSSDIDLAIAKGEQALKLLNNAVAKSDLSTMYLTKFEVFGRHSDLKSASALAKAAVQMLDPTDPSIINKSVNYSQCLRNEYEISGDTKLLDEAIRRLDNAKAMSASETGFPRAKILSNLAQAHMDRYHSKGTGPDLHDALTSAVEAVELANEENDTSSSPIILSNLAAIQQTYFQASGDQSFLDDAITSAKIASEGLGDNIPRRNMCQYNLASMLRDRSSLKYDANAAEADKDLNEAIKTIEGIVHPDNTNKRSYAMQSDLHGRLLQLRYERSDHKDSQSLDQAILKATTSVKIAAELPLDQADYLVQLGDVLKLKYDYDPSDANFNAAISAFRECLEIKYVPPLVRIRACQRAGILYQSRKLWAEASDVVQEGVKWLPKLARGAMERDSQQRVLEGLSGLSTFASSLALQAGHGANKAFEVLEAGRGIIARLTMHEEDWDVPHDQDDQVRTQLQEYKTLREKIRPPLTSGWLEGGYHSALADDMAQRLQDIEKLEECEEKLETRYRLHYRGLSESQLREKAADSTIVAFVVTDFRSDALIVTNTGIQNLELTGLKYHDCAEYYATMQMPIQGALRDLNFETFFDVNESMKKLLVWLWEAAVLPVLKHLNIYPTPTQTASTTYSSIHWITSGILGLMPLHAAGHHEAISTENTHSHVISHYATSTRSIGLISKGFPGTWRNTSDPLKAVVVGMSETPDPWTNFTHVDSHLQAVKHLIPNEADINFLGQPSRASVLDALPAAQVAHFVCHGISQRDPSNSSLILCRQDTSSSPELEKAGSNKTPVYVADPLTVREIASRSNQQSFLAFLAACQTADNATAGLVDENIHLAGAFQLLGFTHVIGTLWEVEESAAASFAHSFYSALREMVTRSAVEEDKAARNASHMIAQAWHDALLALRQQDSEDVVTWGAFVYFGP